MEQRNDKEAAGVIIMAAQSANASGTPPPEASNAHHVNIDRIRNCVMTIATRFSRELGIPTRVLFEPDGSLCFPISGSPFWHPPVSGDNRVCWPGVCVE
jgi:hypothetical protein